MTKRTNEHGELRLRFLIVPITIALLALLVLEIGGVV